MSVPSAAIAGSDVAITLDDKSVQLLMRLDPYQVRRKFKLKEMIFRGRLEL